MKKQLLALLLIVSGIVYGSGESSTALSSKEELISLITKHCALQAKIQSDIAAISKNYDLIEAKMTSLQQRLIAREQEMQPIAIKQVFYRPIEDDYIIWYANGLAIKLDPVKNCQPSLLFKNLQVRACCVYQSDEEHLVVATDQSLELWKGQTVLWSSGKDVRAKDICALYPHPLNKDRVITVHTNGYVKLWDLEERDLKWIVMKHNQKKINLGCTTKSNFFIIAEDNTIKVRNLNLTRDARKTIVPEKIFAVCGDPSNSRFIIVASKEVQVWDMSSKKQECILECDEKVTVLCAQEKGFYGSNNSIIAGTELGRIIVWDASTKSKVEHFQAHTTPITHLIVDKHGRIVTGAQDGTLSIWAFISKDKWEKVGTFKLDKKLFNETL